MAPTTLTFRQFLLRAHTSGALDISKHFELQTDATITYDPEDMQGKVLVKLRWFSNDPAQRTWINGVPEDRHYWKVSGLLVFGEAGEQRLFDGSGDNRLCNQEKWCRGRGSVRYIHTPSSSFPPMWA